jgi:hypothetical protein
MGANSRRKPPLVAAYSPSPRYESTVCRGKRARSKGGPGRPGACAPERTVRWSRGRNIRRRSQGVLRFILTLAMRGPRGRLEDKRLGLGWTDGGGGEMGSCGVVVVGSAIDNGRAGLRRFLGFCFPKMTRPYSATRARLVLTPCSRSRSAITA